MINGEVDLFGKTITLVKDNNEGSIVVLTSIVYCMISKYERIIKEVDENGTTHNKDVIYFKSEFSKLRKQLADDDFTYMAKCRSSSLTRFIYTRYDIVTKLVKIIVTMNNEVIGSKGTTHNDKMFIQPLFHYFKLIMTDLIVYSASLRFNKYLGIICNDIKTLYSKFNKSLNLNELISNFKPEELRYNNSYHVLKEIDESIRSDRNSVKITISMNRISST